MDNKFIVFLNKRNTSSIDFSNSDKLESYFKDLFFKLSDDLGIDIGGRYDIDVFIDKFYGAIVSIIRDDDYFEYCDIVDMNISISRFSNFVYKVSDVYRNYCSCNVYLYDDSLYLEPIAASFYDVGFLFEDCDIVYGEHANDIRLYGKKISNYLFVD